MRLLVGHSIGEFADYDTTRFDVQFVAQDEGKAPLSIAEMIRRCPIGWTPDAYLHPSLGHFALPDDIERFRGLLATYVGDWDRRGRAITMGCGFFDIIAGERNACQRLNAIGYENAHFIRLCGANPKVHRLLPDIERDIDLLFIGSLNSMIWSERNQWVDRIARLSDQYRVVVTFGHFGDEYVELTNRAKIVFNRSVNGITNPRAYDALLCGALVFNEEKNTETREIFEDGVHCVYYNEENLETRLAYYLAHEAERTRIVEQGASLVRREHTDAVHTDTLFALIESQQKVCYRPAMQLSQGERSYRKAMHYYGCLSPNPEASTMALQWLDEAETVEYDRGLVMEGRATMMGWFADMTPCKDKSMAVEAGLNYAREAIKENPDHPIFWMTLGGLLREKYQLLASNEDTARPILIEAISSFEKAAKLCHTLLETDPNNPDSQCTGFGYPCYGDSFVFRFGLPLFHDGLDAVEGLNERASLVAWRCHTILHDLYASLRQTKKAYIHAANAARCQPDDGMAWLRAAQREADLGLFDEALIHYREWFALMPLDYQKWIEMASFLKLHAGILETKTFIEERLQVVRAIPNFASLIPELESLLDQQAT